ncbi:MAG: hybrid sensor histidine kinase/response regulator [Cyanobacteria bacterium P01_E01_bin.42]
MNADILIVDDRPENLRLLSSMLEQQGYRVRNALNGQRALTAVQKQVPDLILLDIKLPDIDGYEVCRQLKSIPTLQPVPILFLSALNGVFDKVKAFQVGGVDYITKPFQEEEILMRVGTQLQLSQQKEQLQHQNQQLAREIRDRQVAQERLQVLLHTVSHDLRNPVAGLGMTLRGAHSNEAGQAILERSMRETMVQSCDRLLRLIDSLTTDPPETEAISLQPQWVVLPTLTQSLLREWRSMFERHRVQLDYRIPKDLPRIEADPDQLARIFDNLIGNALKYNKPGLKLTVAAIPKETEIRCIVADNGIGIPPQQCGRLFDRYVRGQGKKQQGLGLGLYICRQIVEAHGGRIGVKSKPGRGSQFWFTIPV